MDLLIASCKDLPEPDLDAEPLAAALESADIRAEVAAWDDPDVDWSRAPLVLLRSTWNYPIDIDGFLDWAERVAGQAQLWNSVDVVRWNAHKGYLIELQEHGIPVTPTELLLAGTETTLNEVLARRGWEEVVVKPAVSAASFRTLRIGAQDRDLGERHLQSLLAERDVLVQPFLSSVEDYGERALVSVDGELTHAIRKSPRFDGEDESVSEAMPISAAEAELAMRVLGQIEQELLYARIDVAPGPDGDPVVMELELVEPSLFFNQGPEALDRLVNALQRLLAP